MTKYLQAISYVENNKKDSAVQQLKFMTDDKTESIGDRMASAYCLENRCPFLDKNIIEFAFSLPPYLEINDLKQKILIRKLLKKHKKNSALKIEKKGLTITFNKWFKISDWSRDYYFAMLNSYWRKLNNLK